MGDTLVNAEDLAILVRVVDTGGVTRAAEALRIAQPAVTQRLRRLERVLGTRLVERRGRILGLTDAGQTVLPLARQVLKLLDRIPAAIVEVQGLLRGEIVVGASTTVGEFVLPKRLGSFGRAYPHLAVRLRIANTQRTVERVLDHSVSLAFVGLRPRHTALTVQPFVRDEILLVAAEAHPLAGRRISIDALGQTRLLLREEGSATRALAVAALARCGVRTESLTEFGSNAALRTAVLAGYGVAAISREAVADDLQARRVKPIRLPGWRCHRRFYIIYRRDHMLTQAEQTLLRFVRRPARRSGRQAAQPRRSRRGH
jgi:LysR family transcriptional regulator, transcriptional activator of the cysJI operon